MPFEFKFPDIGEGIQEGEIIKWLVKEGDSVKQDQAVVQVETDKAVVDIPSPKAGTILKITKKQGEKIKVGEVLFIIGDKGEKPKPEKVQTPKKGQSVVGELEEAPDEEIELKPHSIATKGVSQQRVLASPATKALASQLNINLSTIQGTGPEGRITKQDLEQKANQVSSIPQQLIPVRKSEDRHGDIEIIPIKGIRKTIAQNMTISAQVPAVTAMEDINITKLWNIREKEKLKLEKQNIKLTMLPFVVKALIAALKENPILNSSLENENIILKKYYNIGIAVETELGLMVPVLKNADTKSLVEIAKEISSLAEKAKTRKIQINELNDSTFTITNYGSVGGKYLTPILNPGESGILGLGRIFDSHSFIKGKVKPIKVLPISLTFDHRVLDGAEAVRFIQTLKSLLEDPDNLLLEMK